MADPTPVDRNQSAPPPIPLVPLGERDRPTAPLPNLLTSFVGREREVADVVDLLRQNGVRLVTLTGPGGVGKTRLAVRVAEELGPFFADGVAFVPLAAVREPAVVGAALAQALGVREAGDRPLADALTAFLRDRRLLLVLDNFEHLLDAAPLVGDVLAACPRLKVLVTSRAVLRVSGEHACRVPPLALPDPERTPPITELRRAEAVRLFAERARAAEAGFALDDDTVGAVAGVCVRLDGLPLAIELAAARVTVLPPQAMLSRLETRLSLLTGGARDQPARLRTMRDALAWSYDLLPDPEQALFRRLAVFVGGCTMDAAEAVGGGPTVLDGIASLVDKSLVRAEPGSGGGAAVAPRYGMLETVREYGLEQLTASGEAEAVRARHAAWCLELAAAAEPSVRCGGRDQARWMTRLDEELGNLRAALGWFQQTGNAAGLLRMAALLDAYWFSRPYLVEARRWVEAGLAGDGEVPAGVRAAALQCALTVACLQGDPAAALRWAEEALSIARGMDDPLSLGRATFGVGEARSFNGDWEGAATSFEEAVPLLRRAGDPTWLANAVASLGDMKLRRGDAAGAVPLIDEAIAIFRTRDDACGVGYALRDRANAALAQGDHALAVQLFVESIAAGGEIGDQLIALDAAAGLAVVALALGPAKPAARLLGAVEAAKEASGFWRPDIPDHLSRIASARAALGEEAFAAAFDGGRAVPPARVAAEAIAVADGLAGTAAPAKEPSAAERAGLTTREVDVLRLLAEGRSDPEIAATLYLSPRTVQWHVANIFRKVGLRSRTAVAAHAARNGLV